MPRRAAPSQAERWRAHREAFELARELGCTPAEAAKELARRAAAARSAEANRRLEALRNPRPAPRPQSTEPPPWMHFD